VETILKIVNKTQIIIILVSLFVVLISISCVSASSTVYVNTTGNDTIGNGSSENPYLTIQKGMDSINPNGTIYIADGTYKDTGNTNLTINKNMTLIGQSQAGTIIDGQGQGSIFTINQGITVILNDLTLTNASTTKNGGAINNNGTVLVSNCNFNKDAATIFGGAIYNNGTLTVSNCNFTQNTALGGGAIHNDGILKVINSTFNNNTVPSGVGGAIANYGNLNMTGCAFDNNFAWFYGGAIYNSKNLNMANCTFKNNTAEEGGAIYNYVTGILNITETSFNNNSVDYSNGGAIYNCGTLSITNSTLTSNTAKIDGGAIYNDGILNITGSTLTNNTAIDDDGGAIYNTANGTLTIKNSTLTGNTAEFDGGAISIWGGTITISETTFNNNSAYYGGAICSIGGTLTINNSKFTGNTAYFGGAIDAYQGELNITDSTFTNNTANTWGGAIDNNQGKLTVKNSTLTGNTAKFDGGAIYNNGTLTLTNSTLTDNTATKNGGAIYHGESNCEIHFNRIALNTADQGSAIYNNNGTVNATLNWWGSNTDPTTIPNPIIVNNTGSVDTSTWVILTVNVTPTIINNTKTSILTADFNHINGGGDLVGGHIPDGPITLEVPWGSLDDAISGTGNLPLLIGIGGSGSPVMSPTAITHSITLNTINGVTAATFYANEGAVNPLFNPVKVTATADNYTTNDTESAYITINKASDLYVKITSNNNNPKLGETFKITYKLGNNGPDGAKNVTIIIPLPEGFKYTDIIGDGSWTYDASTNTITWTLSNVPVGDPYIYITGHVNKPGIYVFSSFISSETYNIDSEGVTPITINAVSEVNAASKTIPMRDTGLPISGLILAILAVFGGLAASKRK
jgi:predicted outer membrane repeat protein